MTANTLQVKHSTWRQLGTKVSNCLLSTLMAIRVIYCTRIITVMYFTYREFFLFFPFQNLSEILHRKQQKDEYKDTDGSVDLPHFKRWIQSWRWKRDVVQQETENITRNEREKKLCNNYCSSSSISIWSLSQLHRTAKAIDLIILFLRCHHV